MIKYRTRLTVTMPKWGDEAARTIYDLLASARAAGWPTMSRKEIHRGIAWNWSPHIIDEAILHLLETGFIETVEVPDLTLPTAADFTILLGRNQGSPEEYRAICPEADISLSGSCLNVRQVLLQNMRVKLEEKIRMAAKSDFTYYPLIWELIPREVPAKE